MSFELFKTNYDWDADCTDLDETEFDNAPRRIYQETASVKMQNCALKKKGDIKQWEREKFLKSITVNIWKDESLKISSFQNNESKDPKKLWPSKNSDKPKFKQIPNEYLSTPSCSLKSNKNSVGEDIKYLLRELAKRKRWTQKQNEDQVCRIETIHDVLPASY